MSIYSDKLALPFFAYQSFLNELKTSEPKMHAYLENSGFVLDEKNYLKSVSNSLRLENVSSREDWELISKHLRDNHVTDIDLTCSELKLLSDHVASTDTVLYAGAGNGDLMDGISELSGASVTGLDYCEGMLRNCRRRGSIVLAECEKLPVKDESMDKIIVAGIDWSKDMIGELKRILKHEGKIIFDLTKPINVSTPYLETDVYEDYIKNFMDINELREHINNGIKSRLKSGVILHYPEMREDINFILSNGLKKEFIFSDIIPLPRPTLEPAPLSYEYTSGTFAVQCAFIGKKP